MKISEGPIDQSTKPYRVRRHAETNTKMVPSTRYLTLAEIKALAVLFV